MPNPRAKDTTLTRDHHRARRRTGAGALVVGVAGARRLGQHSRGQRQRYLHHLGRSVSVRHLQRLYQYGSTAEHLVQRVQQEGSLHQRCL